MPAQQGTRAMVPVHSANAMMVKMPAQITMAKTLAQQRQRQEQWHQRLVGNNAWATRAAVPGMVQAWVGHFVTPITLP